MSQEVAGLQEVCSALFLEVNEMKEERVAIRKSKTLKGRFFNLVGHGFVVYCVYKMVMVSPTPATPVCKCSLSTSQSTHYLRQCTVNIVFSRNPKKDPITRGFELLLWVRYYHPHNCYHAKPHSHRCHLSPGAVCGGP